MRIAPAYAKVNLCLEVTARRPDGWHDLDSVIVPIDWHDLVGVTLQPAGTAGVSLRVTPEGAAPAGDDNLAARAAAALLNSRDPARVEIWLHKRIPAGAGLGGGSADAAAVLRAVSAAGAGSAAQIDTIAAQLGADVPIQLAATPARVRGRGESFQPLRPAKPLHLAVAVAGFSSTAATFAALEPAEITATGRAAEVAGALAAGRSLDPRLLGSALEAAAVRLNPQLGETLHRLRALGVPWHLTGSGGAAFSLTATRADAQALAARAAALGLPARACTTLAHPPA